MRCKPDHTHWQEAETLIQRNSVSLQELWMAPCVRDITQGGSLALTLCAASKTGNGPWARGARFRFLESYHGPGAPLRIGMALRRRQVLSVSVEMSVSVHRAVECQMTCS